MWRQFRNPMLALMYAPEGDGAPGGGGGAEPPALAPAPPANGGTPPAPPSGTPPAPAGGTPPPPAGKSYTFAEDRSSWIPPNRLSEVAERARRSEETALRYSRMIEAGTGLKLPAHLQSPEDRENAAAQAELLKIFPRLALLEKLDKMFPQLEDAVTRLPDALASGEQYWVTQGHRTLQTLQSGVAEMYGIKATELSPLQKETIGNSFMSWMSRNEDAAKRYAVGDTDVVNDFLTEWRNGFFEPARRFGGGGGNPPPPNGGRPNRNDLPPAPRGSALVPGGGAPPKPKTEEEVHDAAWAGFKAALDGNRR